MYMANERRGYGERTGDAPRWQDVTGTSVGGLPSPFLPLSVQSGMRLLVGEIQSLHTEGPLV